MKITKQYIKDLEKYEYNELMTLKRIKERYVEEGNEVAANKLDESIHYQMGRWGMMNALVEKMEEK